MDSPCESMHSQQFSLSLSSLHVFNLLEASQVSQCTYVCVCVYRGQGQQLPAQMTTASVCLFTHSHSRAHPLPVCCGSSLAFSEEGAEALQPSGMLCTTPLALGVPFEGHLLFSDLSHE